MQRLILFLVFGFALACATLSPTSSRTRWWKGNTHTHTLWSDGDGAPELVADWYRSRGYHFLVLSDHNVLSEGETWFPISQGGRLKPDQVTRLEKDFGREAVQQRNGSDGEEMRLATLLELRERFEIPGSFRFVQGEEVTGAFGEAPVHINGLGLDEVIQPLPGSSLLDTVQRNIDAIHAQGKRIGKPTLAHLNHPNFGWALSVEELAGIRGNGFIEIFNGHPFVNNYGDATHLATERAWDIALSMRMRSSNPELLFGVASDDAHNYFSEERTAASPGRGWVHVRAASLACDDLIRAMLRGDFYASSGVELTDIGTRDDSYFVDIATEPGVTYTTTFIGTRRDAIERDEMGVVLLKSTSNPATYVFRGDELFVRAKVTSSLAHPNPYAEGDRECAWGQPVPGPAAGVH